MPSSAHGATDLRTLKPAVDRLRLRLATAKERKTLEARAMVEAEDASFYATEAATIVQTIAQAIQQEAHARVAGVVTRCLAAVFPDPYEFRIEFDRKRGRTEARMEIDPQTAAGGGVVDVAAFALRLSAILLAQPQRRRVMVLDEPFKFLSADRRDAVRDLLETLSAELGVQFVIVTHIDELQAGTVVRI
jgi:ABC-type sugar transport system ATPase subunit